MEGKRGGGGGGVVELIDMRVSQQGLCCVLLTCTEDRILLAPLSTLHCMYKQPVYERRTRETPAHRKLQRVWCRFRLCLLLLPAQGRISHSITFRAAYFRGPRGCFRSEHTLEALVRKGCLFQQSSKKVYPALSTTRVIGLVQRQ